MSGSGEAYMRVPAGVPLSILVEAAEKFNLKVVELEVNVPPPTDEAYWRPRTLVLKGNVENLERARAYIIEKLEERARELERGRYSSSSGGGENT